jgi:hexosaminidase
MSTKTICRKRANQLLTSLNKSVSLSFCALLISTLCLAQTLVPAPNTYEPRSGGGFALSPKATLVYANATQLPVLQAFNQMMQAAYGFQLPTAAAPVPTPAIVVTPSDSLRNPEAYTLTVADNAITITHAERGLMPALATLLQLLPAQAFANTTLAACHITDAPRFAYRGMHLDVSRHFMPVHVVKKYIDYLAMFKFNTFHWHLTDDQGWRIEIKKYPLLTEVGGWRGGTIIGKHPGTGNTNQRHGGYYTQEAIKEVVAYAAARQITIIPEIEMPGHSSAAIAAYPWLSCFPQQPTDTQNWQLGQSQRPATTKQVQETWGVFEDVFCPSDSTFGFLEDVLDEVVALFPGKYIHIGGDECPKEAWKRSAFCQQLIKKEGLKDEHGLQSYFIGRIEKYLNGKGRQIIGWDEILEGGLAPNASVMSWRGEEGGIAAAKMKHPVVMTPGGWVYFDHSQSKFDDSLTIGGFTSLEKTYSYEPVPAGLTPTEAAYIMGAQGNVWTEYISNAKKLEYMIFPRMMALGDVLWSRQKHHDWDAFLARMPQMAQRLDHLGIEYSTAQYDLQEQLSTSLGERRLEWRLTTNHPTALISVKTPQPDVSRIVVRVPDLAQDPDFSRGLMKDSVFVTNLSEPGSRFNIPLNQSGVYTAEMQPNGQKKQVISRTVTISKSTGRVPTLTQAPGNHNTGDLPGFALVDGIRGDPAQVHSPQWVGWQGQSCEAVIALDAATKLSKLVFCGLEHHKSWIYKPTQITVWTSTDGKNYTKRLSTDANTPVELDSKGMFKVALPFATVTASYVKVLATSLAKIPVGQPGAGEPAWLFADELELY